MSERSEEESEPGEKDSDFILHLLHYDYNITVDDFVAPDDMSEPSEEESEPEDKGSDFI